MLTFRSEYLRSHKHSPENSLKIIKNDIQYKIVQTSNQSQFTIHNIPYIAASRSILWLFFSLTIDRPVVEI